MPRSAWAPSAAVSGSSDLVDAVAGDVRRGRLKAGDRLPGSRALATLLGLNRKTVVAAFAELEAEGWIRLRGGSGARVAPQLLPAAARKARRSPTTSPNFPLPASVPSLVEAEPPNVLRMAGGQPDLRLLPLDDLARAWRRALREGGRELCDYADPRGERLLLDALGDWLAENRGVRAAAGGMLVTRGSQGALYLVARALLRPGDRVAVEAWGYRPAWEAFRAAGLDLEPIPVDAGGLDVDALARLPRDGIRAVYLSPHHQYPTGAVLDPGRRARLLTLARERRFFVLEDDYDHEFHYAGRPVLPLAAADPHACVVYVGTLSKAFAPGLRVGFVVAHPTVVDRLCHYRRLVDRQGDHVTERAVAELILDGTVDRHLRRARRVYQRRRTVLRAALRASFGDRLRPNDPPGGLALWTEAPGIDVDAWARCGLREGVEITTAARYAFDGSSAPFVRIGFACLDEGELVEAVRRLALAWS